MAKKNFWDKTAGLYDAFMKKDEKAYERMYELICPKISGKRVLELAAGTGMISKNVASVALSYEATDASEKMIEEAEKGCGIEGIFFSVRNMFSLDFPDKAFDAVIVGNALHIVPNPEKALYEIRRVLKDDGVLIAPTFTHAENSFKGKIRAFFMKAVGFPLESKWSGKEYLEFLERNGWRVEKSLTLKASFPLTYAECGKKF